MSEPTKHSQSGRYRVRPAIPSQLRQPYVARKGDPGEIGLKASSAFDRVDPCILCSFSDLVVELGGDPDAMLRRVNIEPAAPDHGERDVSYRQVVDLVALAATELPCPDFGMRLAKVQAGLIRTPLCLLVRNSRTLGEALENVVSHSYAHSLAAAIWLKRCPGDETIMVGHDILIAGSPDRRQAIEQILLTEYLTCREATGGAMRARRVEFRHQAVSPLARYRAYFGCEVLFGKPADAIVYGEQALSCPITTADPSAFRRNVATIEASFVQREPPLRATVRGMIAHLIDSDGCTNAGIAAELSMHIRTLNRRLRQEGTSFQQIKNQLRRDLLIHYLEQTDFPISEISERLGFAEQSAMTRFCRRWLADSPTGRRMAAKHHQ